MFYLFLRLYCNFTRYVPSLFDNSIDSSDNLFYLNYNVFFMTWRGTRPEVSLGKVPWKYTANLQENTQAEV